MNVQPPGFLSHLLLHPLFEDHFITDRKLCILLPDCGHSSRLLPYGLSSLMSHEFWCSFCTCLSLRGAWLFGDILTLLYFSLIPHVAHPSRTLGTGLRFSSTGDLPNGSWPSLHDSILYLSHTIVVTCSFFLLNLYPCCFLGSLWSLPQYVASQECSEINEPPIEGDRMQQGRRALRGKTANVTRKFGKVSTAQVIRGTEPLQVRMILISRRGKKQESPDWGTVRSENQFGDLLRPRPGGVGAERREHWAGGWGSFGQSDGEGCFAPGRVWA